jgi:membrane-bound toxin of toxin-antitoxin system
MDLTVGSRSRYTSWWVHLQLRGADRAVDVVVLKDQLDERTWRALQAELRRARPDV